MCIMEPPEIKATPSLDRARELLGKKLRLTLSDGRILQGLFACLDKSGTIVLNHAVEITSDSKPKLINPRAGGVVIIPGQHIVKAESPTLASTLGDLEL